MIFTDFLWWIGRHSVRFRRWAYKHEFKWAWWGVFDYINNSSKLKNKNVGSGTITLEEMEELFENINLK